MDSILPFLLGEQRGQERDVGDRALREQQVAQLAVAVAEQFRRSGRGCGGFRMHRVQKIAKEKACIQFKRSRGGCELGG